MDSGQTSDFQEEIGSREEGSMEEVKIESGCHTCGFRARAEQKPGSLLARLWRWHTGWCPGWKAYQAHLAEQAAK